ncbi:ISL3 family transposase ISMac21 [Fibrobacterales bacterium]|nr:ISL3 family transposase ISMac21 [Fibrobacterales bacterium]
MFQKQLFSAALGLSNPWQVTAIDFNAYAKRLDIHIDFTAGSKFSIGDENDDGTAYPVHDTVEKEWRHLNFFQHECYLHARTPRVKLADGSVRLVTPPWAGKSRGFTLLFEALLMQLLTCMPVKQVEKICHVDDNKLWRMIGKYVDTARCFVDMSGVLHIGVDETSIRKGHEYVSLFVDTDKPAVLFVTEGKDAKTFDRFSEDMSAHVEEGVVPKIESITMDMSPAFIKGAAEHFPEAEVVFDKFHIMKIFNEATDKVRRMEIRETEKNLNDELKDLLRNSRWALLKNKDNLTEKQYQKRMSIEMKGKYIKAFRMLRMRENLQDIYVQSISQIDFECRMRVLRNWLMHSKIEQAKEVGRMMKSHWNGIISWFKYKRTNAILEGINSLIKAAAAKARGFKTFRNYSSIIYLIAGKLDFSMVNPNFKPT